jgi:hypothetical protein
LLAFSRIRKAAFLLVSTSCDIEAMYLDLCVAGKQPWTL